MEQTGGGCSDCMAVRVICQLSSRLPVSYLLPWATCVRGERGGEVLLRLSAVQRAVVAAVLDWSYVPDYITEGDFRARPETGSLRQTQ